LNKPSGILKTVQTVEYDNFKLFFDLSHAYMCAVIGARQTGAREFLPGGVAEFAEMLSDYIGHLHLIDSDGTLHNGSTSTHSPFGQGLINFAESFKPIRSDIMDLERWTADYCFCAETEAAGKKAPEFMKSLAMELDL
jgi:sugar phosphate isomerase/epimerase